MSASDERSESDAEWAAGVMGWEVRIDPELPNTPYYADGQRELFDTGCWNPDTDANDFRDLLNCEAVQRSFGCPGLSWVDFREVWMDALTDQPAALRRLREAMEGPSGREGE